MADFLAGKGRRIMGWDEIPEDGAIRQDAVAMVRRADTTVSSPAPCRPPRWGTMWGTSP